jgi:hypothetical protein
MGIRGLSLLFLFWCLAASGQQQSVAAARGSISAEAQAKSDTGHPVESASPSGSATSPNTAPVPDLKPDEHGNLSQEQMQQLFRIVADKDIENEKKLRDYTFVERDEEHKLDGKGNVASTESETFEIVEVYGKQVQRKIAKNDQPLSIKDAAREEEKIQKIMEKRRNESESDRKKREQQEAKEQEEGRQWVREIADAYNFQLLGSETIAGRDNWVIEGEPRPGFRPHLKYANYLADFHGRVWIDKEDLQFTKMDVECINTASWGLFVARLHKGSRFLVEQTRVNDEVWLPKHVAVKLDARFALFKNFDIEKDDTYRDYKKFRTSTTIRGVQEIKP